MTPLPLSSAYRDAIRMALFVQGPLTFLLTLILDGGILAKTGGCAMVGFWAGAAIVMCRRPQAPRADDLLYIRCGYLPLFGIGMLLAVTIGGAFRSVLGL